MPRSLAIGLAAVIVLAGIGYGSFRAGWWPGTATAAPDHTFEQSRVDELREDQSTVGTISTDIAAATPAGRDVLVQQGHDVVAQACTISSEIRQLPGDLADFVHQNCSDGELAASSPFAGGTAGGGTPSSADPDPGAN